MDFASLRSWEVSSEYRELICVKTSCPTSAFLATSAASAAVLCFVSLAQSAISLAKAQSWMSRSAPLLASCYGFAGPCVSRVDDLSARPGRAHNLMGLYLFAVDLYFLAMLQLSEERSGRYAKGSGRIAVESTKAHVFLQRVAEAGNAVMVEMALTWQPFIFSTSPGSSSIAWTSKLREK